MCRLPGIPIGIYTMQTPLRARNSPFVRDSPRKKQLSLPSGFEDREAIARHPSPRRSVLPPPLRNSDRGLFQQTLSFSPHESRVLFEQGTDVCPREPRHLVGGGRLRLWRGFLFVCVHFFRKGERDEKGGGARTVGFREDRWRRLGSDGYPKSVFAASYPRSNLFPTEAHLQYVVYLKTLKNKKKIKL